MSPIYCCCCCFKSSQNLVSLRTKSSNEDDKTLWDYLNCVFETFVSHHQVSDLICPRCSKALKVAYHFINMVNKLKASRKSGPINLPLPEIRHKIDDNKQNNPLHEWQNENQLKVETNSKTATQTGLPSHLSNTSKLFLSDFDEDVQMSLLMAKQLETEFICNICKTRFEDKTSFEEHNRHKHKEIIPYKCKLCSFYTCYAESLFKHCAKNHGLNNVALDFYQHKEVPQIAADGPEFEITYSCIYCNFEDPDPGVVDEHFIDQHSIVDDRESSVRKRFSCPACCRSFRSRKAAKIHFSMHHISLLKNDNSGKNKKFSCEKCGKVFDLKRGLLLHRSACETRKSVNCNFCNLEFSTVLKYERHIQETHLVAIKHECETCRRTFDCSEYLAVHRKRHNQRDFQCDLCPKTYINNAELKVHKQRIHDIKHAAMTSSVCEKKFSSSVLLKHHENKMDCNTDLLRHDFCQLASNSGTTDKNTSLCQS